MRQQRKAAKLAMKKRCQDAKEQCQKEIKAAKQALKQTKKELKWRKKATQHRHSYDSEAHETLAMETNLFTPPLGENSMQVLQDMGFVNTELNQQLLAQHNYDVGVVIPILLKYTP